MIPDYFTSYRRQLESYEAILSEKLNALLTFVKAVGDDWESVRTKRALMRLDEIQIQVEQYLKKLNQSISVSEFLKVLPGDLPHLYKTVWNLISDLTKDSVPRPITSEEVITNSFFQKPEVALLLQRTFEKVRTEIQTTLIPVNLKATVYVDQRLEAELREAFRSAFSADHAGRTS